MKTNRKQLCAVDEFQRDIQKAITKYYVKQYKDSIADNVRRALKDKKGRQNKYTRN